MGHYANVKKIKGINYLTKAKDELRDQTYFLCYLNQKQIDDTIFPIGNLTKEEVREIAKKNNLHTWNRKNSTGICFIGERDFNKFLLNYIKPKSGKIIDVCTNSVLGTHTGINFYTIGQNKNLGLGGNKTRYFVCDKNIKSNVLYVCASNFVDKYLSSTQCLLRDFN
jgi:tRNA-specific 2-thiouridylase